MTDVEVLGTLEALGLELRRRGRDWAKYLPGLRVLYLHTRDGTTPGREQWDLKHGLDLAGQMGIGPKPWALRSFGSDCPTCPPNATGPAHMGYRRTFGCGTLPDRHAEHCLICGIGWVVPQANFVFSPGDARANAGHPRRGEASTERPADTCLSEAEQRHVA